MDTTALLEKILAGGRELAEKGTTVAGELAEQGKAAARQGFDLAADKLGVPVEGEQRDAMLSGLGKGALAGGVLALLLGTKSGRKIASPALKLGSLAALGAIGYKVYKNYQQSQGVEVQDGSIAAIDGPAAETRSIGLIKAMIAAAKADGTVDAEETARIVDQINAANLGDHATSILMTEVQRPLDVNEVASHADSPEAAIEMYLASLVVIDKESAAEKTYLEQLASALNLNSDLVQQLETEAFAPA